MEMEALTVSDLKRLCSERDLIPGRLRKQQIIELLKSDGLEELPSTMVVRVTPRKTTLTPSRSRRSKVTEEQKDRTETPRRGRRKTKVDVIEADKENSSKSTASTTRRSTRLTRARDSRSAEDVDAGGEVKKTAPNEDINSNRGNVQRPRNSRSHRRNTSKLVKSSSDEEKCEMVESTQGRRRSLRNKSSTKRPSANNSESNITRKEKEEESPVEEAIPHQNECGQNKNGPHQSKQMDSKLAPLDLKQDSVDFSRSNANDSGETNPTTNDDIKQDPQAAFCHDNHVNEGKKVGSADENQVAPSLHSHDIPTSQDQQRQPDEAESSAFVQAAAFPTEPTEKDIASSVLSNDADNNNLPSRQRKTWNLNSIAQFNFARGEDSSPGSSPTVSIQRESDKSSHIVERQLSFPVISRKNTFVIETPSIISRTHLKEQNLSSQFTFKASKAPDFKRLHERQQARVESIADDRIRKFDRMRQLLKSARAIRERGRPSLNNLRKPSVANIKTTYATPVSSVKKILSAKVRSNRRFDLLMKARGVIIEEQANDLQQTTLQN